MMHKNKDAGLTLLELLVVVLILTLLISLLLPVLITARKYAQRAGCISNMRQIHTAWTLYVGDYGGSTSDMRCWPRWRNLIPSYVKDTCLIVCPIDPANGWMRVVGADATSYAYLEPFAPLTEDILKVDTNPGVVACYLHGQCRLGGLFPHCKGLVLRIRIDGSLGRGYFPVICYQNGFGLVSWYFFTDSPCPEIYLGGGQPCDPPSW